jgi:ribosomal protein S18 acetylase RimI-like enzyme
MGDSEVADRRVRDRGFAVHRVTASAQDNALLGAIAGLVAAGVERREALGLLGPLTSSDYRKWLDELLADAVHGNAGLVAAADPEGAVLGTGQWVRSPYATRRVLAEVDRVVVTPVARGLGIGRAVVEAIIADAAEQGIEVLWLEVRGNNHAAVALYQGCGFVRTGVLPNAVADGQARHDVVLMCLEMSRPEGVLLHGSDAVGSGASEAR